MADNDGSDMEDIFAEMGLEADLFGHLHAEDASPEKDKDKDKSKPSKSKPSEAADGANGVGQIFDNSELPAASVRSGRSSAGSKRKRDEDALSTSDGEDDEPVGSTVQERVNRLLEAEDENGDMVTIAWNMYKIIMIETLRVRVPHSDACRLCCETHLRSYASFSWSDLVAKVKALPSAMTEFMFARSLVEDPGKFKPFRDEEVRVITRTGCRLESSCFFITLEQLKTEWHIDAESEPAFAARVIVVKDEYGFPCKGIPVADPMSKLRRLHNYCITETVHEDS
ncbi:unnamed protein product [Symbiodinium necroappetens]|uniref:Uncharacterized protein n=1 Tax=Symbiodinium necroappetens TaxID=1628268 RepID=A0A813AJN5_9DINO|nr:unnamed protein product [Symbiodinium sp. CCMP2456]CAE7868571.1 unnamed protein product [Symbiodinium necroappetens]